MGNGLFTGCLDRFFRQRVAGLAFSAAFIKLSIRKVTQMAGGLGHLKFFLFGFMLMAGGAVELLAVDLILFFQVRFMDESDFFRKLYLLSLEGVFGIPMTVGCHAAGVGYPGSCLDDVPAEFNV